MTEKTRERRKRGRPLRGGAAANDNDALLRALRDAQRALSEADWQALERALRFARDKLEGRGP